jgi:predicted GNAT family N-acyltransferase
MPKDEDLSRFLVIAHTVCPLRLNDPETRIHFANFGAVVIGQDPIAPRPQEIGKSLMMKALMQVAT